MDFGRPGAPAATGDRVRLTPVAFETIPGWAGGDQTQALGAFLRSCDALERKPAAAPVRAGDYENRMAAFHQACATARQLGAGIGPENARKFFENWFTAFRMTDGAETAGLVTGYFEPLLNGSRRPSARYFVPLHGKPGDLVVADLGRFQPDFKGRTISGRVENGRLVPYDDRARIAKGSLAGKAPEILWVDNPIDAFFLHIQGSGRVQLADGEQVRVGFAGKNGQPYFAIGRELVARGALTRENVSLQSIRAWLEANPDEAEAVMHKNRSYVFFREVTGDGPIGAQGIALTPERSLAVDPKYIPYGTPVWLETTHPVTPSRPIRRLMIAQDTGGAIRGPLRADYFWGAGAAAREAAGKMKQPGNFVLLLPK